MKPCLLLSLLLAGCAVGPNYRRPAVPVPPEFQGPAAGSQAASLGEAKWPDLFQDERLHQLIAAALEHNFDLGIASERVQEARARYRIAAGDEYPSVAAQAGFTANRPSRIGSSPFVPANASMDASYTQSGGALHWELDLWGRLRRMTEAARAQYLASEEGRRGVIVSLVSEVTGGYFTLRERDLELEIAEATRKVAEQNLRLIEVRHDHGAATGLDLHQAEQFLYTATGQMANSQREIGQAENALNLLLGQASGAIARGRVVDDFGLPPEVPAGLPSALLERRPDIRQAEQLLIAANAEIGVARASL
ncbi:MAG TPA: efflux transporter outer membrane subunit, partial [Bryobacteraceae bacterium]|nr:efflux transporter outer membrane subunit [Bryobacteraceae bacterium]